LLARYPDNDAILTLWRCRRVHRQNR
jgi:hypothetical protein